MTKFLFPLVVSLLIAISFVDAHSKIQTYDKKPESKDCLIEYTGTIDDNFVSLLKVLSKCKTQAYLQLNSTGGKSTYGIEAAKIIKKYEVTIFITHYCNSSCYEFVLPAAKKVYFLGNPIVALHGSPAVMKEVFRRHGLLRESCKHTDATRQREIVSISESEFNQYIDIYIRKLGIEAFLVEETYPCPTVDVQFKYQSWLPDSEHIRMYIPKSEGMVCADSAACIKEKLLKKQESKVSIIG